MAVANCEVRTLNEGEAQILCQIRMLKVCFVVRTRREEHDAGVLASRHANQRVSLSTEERGQPHHVRVAEELGKQIGNDGAVFKRVTASRRGLCAVR